MQSVKKPLPNDVDTLKRRLSEVLSENRVLQEENRLLKQKLFGPKSEKITEEESRQLVLFAQTAFTACKAVFLARGFLAAHARYALWGYGGTGRALARALAAHGKQLGRVIELHPRRLGQRIHGAPVVPPAALGEAEARALPLIVSVAGATPRAEIRAELAALGYTELRDFVCAA